MLYSIVTNSYVWQDGEFQAPKVCWFVITNPSRLYWFIKFAWCYCKIWNTL